MHLQVRTCAQEFEEGVAGYVAKPKWMDLLAVSCLPQQRPEAQT